MRVLVVFCHPVPESFGAALRDLSVRTLREAGNEVELLDLYAMGFDPVMSTQERRVYNTLTEDDPHPEPEHARLIRWAEGLLFVYPTWWYGLPAMLKGWIDRVWTPGFAFTMPEDGGAIEPLMRHIRKIGIVSTCGAPRWASFLMGQPGRKTILRGIRALCARRCSTFWMAHYEMDSSTPDSRAAYLVEVEKKLSRF